MKPRNLKQALENGYIISNIYAKGSKTCRVDVKPRFFNAGMEPLLSYWISSNYVKRVYPNAYDRF